MSDSFAFRASRVPLRRRIDRRRARTVIVGAFIATGVVTGVVRFALWTIASERASFAAMRRRAPAPIVHPAGAPSLTSGTVPAADLTARRSARDALDAARRLLGNGGAPGRAAGPGQLGNAVPGLVFTDGPSRAPGIVSVAATSTRWAAAARSAGGTCFFVRWDRDGPPRFGTGSPCTGTAALDASDPAW